MSSKMIKGVRNHELSFRNVKVLVFETNVLLGKGLVRYFSERMGLEMSVKVVTNAVDCVRALEDKPHLFISGHSKEALSLIAGKCKGTSVIFHTSPEEVVSSVRYFAHNLLQQQLA